MKRKEKHVDVYSNMENELVIRFGAIKGEEEFSKQVLPLGYKKMLKHH